MTRPCPACDGTGRGYRLRSRHGGYRDDYAVCPVCAGAGDVLHPDAPGLTEEAIWIELDRLLREIEEHSPGDYAAVWLGWLASNCSGALDERREAA